MLFRGFGSAFVQRAIAFSMLCCESRDVVCRNTPGSITGLGLVLLCAAVAAVIAVPDDSSSLIVAQAVIASVLVSGGFAALAGASLLSDLQQT